MFRVVRALVCLRSSRQSPFFGRQKSPGFVSFQSHSLQYHSLFINPPHDEVPELTTLQLVEIFAKDIGQAREYSKEGLARTEEKRRQMMELLPTENDVLEPRKMKDSYVSAIVPLKSQPEIRERYVTTDGKVRIGRLLEDLDVFAVYSCFKHIKNPKSAGHQNPYSVVTALVDSIHITNDRFKPDEDVRLSGHVTYTGKSSMEVCIIVDQKDNNGVYQKFFDSVFLMVARDPMNTGSARINSLLAETPEEIEFMKKGVARQEERKRSEAESFEKKPPNKEEGDIIHTRFLEKIRNPTKILPSNKKCMKDSILKTVTICQPQYRNRYNKIFGGFIMRQAYELAWSNTFMFAKRRPKIVNIDDIKFKLPVEIGQILGFRSHIGYVEGDFVHTIVSASVVCPDTGESNMTNEFQFTFRIPCDDATNCPVPDVEFQTYDEAIQYLHARRHFKKMMMEFGKEYEN